MIRALDPARHHFFLAVYGVHAARVLRYAASFAHVTILPAVEPADFELIDIHLVSLEPPWDHVCVPSKAVSAVCAGACLLLCASDQGDNWNLLHDAAWRIAPGPGMADEVARFVNSLTPAAVAEKRRRTHAIREQLEAMRTRAFGEIWHAMRAMLNFEF